MKITLIEGSYLRKYSLNWNTKRKEKQDFVLILAFIIRKLRIDWCSLWKKYSRVSNRETCSRVQRDSLV